MENLEILFLSGSLLDLKSKIDTIVESKTLSLEEAQNLYYEECLPFLTISDLNLSLEDVKILYEKAEKGIAEGIVYESLQEYWQETENFISYVRPTISFFERILNHPNFRRGYYRIDIIFMDIVHTDKILVQGKRETLGEYSGYYMLEIPVDYKKFMALSNYEKKKESLELLMTGIRKIAEQQNWDMKPFEEAYDKIVEADYINEWKRDKPKELTKHKTRKLRAGLGKIDDIEKVEIFFFICDNKGNEVYRETMATRQLPNKSFVTKEDRTFQKFLGSFTKDDRLGWKGEYKLALHNSSRKFGLDCIQEAKEQLENNEDLSERLKKEYEDLVNDKEKLLELSEEPENWVFTVPFKIITNAPLD